MHADRMCMARILLLHAYTMQPHTCGQTHSDTCVFRWRYTYMCGINYFQLLNCLLYHIIDYYTPGSLLAVAVTYTNTKKHLKTSTKLYDITINIPSTNNQLRDILCMLSQMHINIHIYIYIFAVCFFVHFALGNSRFKSIACRMLRM